VIVPPEPGVYLNTALDVTAPPRLPITPGTWQLRFEFFAIDFPVLSVLIELNFSNWNDPTVQILAQEQIS
jgi:hypothetical protein